MLPHILPLRWFLCAWRSAIQISPASLPHVRHYILKFTMRDGWTLGVRRRA
jgi:hypothetical protein